MPNLSKSMVVEFEWSRFAVSLTDFAIINEIAGRAVEVGQPTVDGATDYRADIEALPSAKGMIRYANWTAVAPLGTAQAAARSAHLAKTALPQAAE